MSVHPSNFSDLFECVNKIGVNTKEDAIPSKKISKVKENFGAAEEKPVEGCGSKIKETEEEAGDEDPRAKNAVLVIMGRAEGVKEDQVHAVLQAMADAQDDDLMMTAINSMRMANPVEVPVVDEPEMDAETPEPEIDADMPEEEEVPDEED